MSTQSYQKCASQILDVIVFSTCEHDMFSLDETNRPIDWDHVQELYDAIEAKNLLHLCPMIVSSEFVVLDGQHRLKAAEGLEVPIYYIISDDMSIEDVPIVTSRLKNWKREDVLHHYCARGFPEYLKLRDFAEEHPRIRLNTIIGLCTYRDSKVVSRSFIDGSYECNDIPFAKRVISALHDFRDVGIDFWHQTTFVNAVANLMANANYDHGIMIGKLEYLSRKVVRCPDMDTYIAMLSEIYNYMARQNRTELRKLNPMDRAFRVDRKEISRG